MISWGQLADASKLSGGSCGPVLSREIGDFANAQSQRRTVLERVMVINKLNIIFVDDLGVEGNRAIEKHYSNF